MFPIIGYLFFGWSFLVIILFYLIDQLGSQINFFARLRFVQTLYLPKKKVLFPVAVILFISLFLAELYFIYILFQIYFYDCQQSFLINELIEFCRQELWLFLPALVVLNYLKDKMTFYKTDLPYKQSPEKMLLLNAIKILSTAVLIALLWLLWVATAPAKLWLILVLASFKLLFDALIFPRLKQVLFKKI